MTAVTAMTTITAMTIKGKVREGEDRDLEGIAAG